jgi:o-succinylbenzoate synthase
MRVYSIPMRTRFRGITVREGVLLEGTAGWGEWSPFVEYPPEEAEAWLRCAEEAAAGDWPDAVRRSIPVNVTVPVVPAAEAHALVLRSGCGTAKVKVADPGSSAADDLDRVEAVRDALGRTGRIRVDANGAWSIEEAVAAIAELDRAARGLEYVEQPCAAVEELAVVRRRVRVPIAADESIRRAEDPLAVARAGAADVAVVKCTPLGGVRRSLAVAEQVEAVAQLPVVVSSALETSVGLAAELALAGALPRLELACGVGTLALLAGDLVARPVVLTDGSLPVPAGPPVPDAAALVRWEQPDPARREWWIDRLRRAQATLRVRLARPNPSA